jgi:hypothetical protein
MKKEKKKILNIYYTYKQIIEDMKYKQHKKLFRIFSIPITFKLLKEISIAIVSGLIAYTARIKDEMFI